MIGLGLWLWRSQTAPEQGAGRPQRVDGAAPAVLADGYDPAPRFRLLDHRARPFSSEDLDGKPWVADFIFTRCQGICPMMNAQSMALLHDLPDLRLVSFSADPEYDTPQVLSAYAAKLGVETEDRWTFVTGDKQALSDVSKGFHFNAIDEPMMHSGRFVLVDARGVVRGYFDASDPEQLDRLKLAWRAATGEA